MFPRQEARSMQSKIGRANLIIWIA